jgi:putative ATPase
MSNRDLPLALRLRPTSLEEFVGQKHLLGEGRLLKRIILSGRITSLIFYGPAGCGKTTLGYIIANQIKAEFRYLNAAFSSVSEVKKVLDEAKKRLKLEGKKTILFIDEIHRFNKLQQEALVPDTEKGAIIFIGGTIYNPYYYLLPSLISRSIVAQFKPLLKEDITVILKRALQDKKNGLGSLNIKISDEALDYIATNSSGDARKALTGLEIGALTTLPDKEGRIVFDLEVAKQTIQKNIFYDKKDSYHYDTISAFIKSIRGSDPDSALYWLAKMLVSGEDPRFIARRLVILASEDIGNADPKALILATSCFKAVEFVGMPEAGLILAQGTIYLASSPKSNSSYLALQRAMKDIEEDEVKEVPPHLKTHSKDYKYPHAFGGYVKQEYGAKRRYYYPGDVGEERRLKEFLEQIRDNRKDGSQKIHDHEKKCDVSG